MITKSEEEYIMDEAIRNTFADYLKLVNPIKYLLSLKKNLHQLRLVYRKPLRTITGVKKNSNRSVHG